MPRKKTPANERTEPLDSDAKSVDEQKAEALDLLDKGEKKIARKGRATVPASGQGSVYGHLGKENPVSTLSEMKAASARAASSRAAAVDSVADAKEEDSEALENSVEIVGDKKIIHIKPPIIVKELAAMMELKPFLLIQDLMEMDVFANLGQAIEPEVASRLCEKHGFIFEKEKREKGAGVHKVEEVIEVPEVQDIEEVEEDKLFIRPPVVTFMGHVDH